MSLEQGVELATRLSRGSQSVVEEEESGGGEWRWTEEREAINYKVDTFNRGLKSNHLPQGIGKQQIQSTIPIWEASCSDKDCLCESSAAGWKCIVCVCPELREVIIPRMWCLKIFIYSGYMAVVFLTSFAQPYPCGWQQSTHRSVLDRTGRGSQRKKKNPKTSPGCMSTRSH